MEACPSSQMCISLPAWLIRAKTLPPALEDRKSVRKSCPRIDQLCAAASHRALSHRQPSATSGQPRFRIQTRSIHQRKSGTRCRIRLMLWKTNSHLGTSQWPAPPTTTNRQAIGSSHRAPRPCFNRIMARVAASRLCSRREWRPTQANSRSSRRASREDLGDPLDKLMLLQDTPPVGQNQTIH